MSSSASAIAYPVKERGDQRSKNIGSIGYSVLRPFSAGIFTPDNLLLRLRPSLQGPDRQVGLRLLRLVAGSNHSQFQAARFARVLHCGFQVGQREDFWLDRLEV